MLLYLVRHPATQKVEDKRFSGCSDDDLLSEAGLRDVERFRSLREFLVLYTYAASVFSSPEPRCIQVASLLSETFAVEQRLVPIVYPELSGLKLREVPSHVQDALSLSRAGLLSGTDIPIISQYIPDLFRRVDNLAEEITTADYAANTLVIVIAHQTVLGALAISLLRLSGRYPKNFDGFISIEPGAGIVMEVTAGAVAPIASGISPTDLVARLPALEELKHRKWGTIND